MTMRVVFGIVCFFKVTAGYGQQVRYTVEPGQTLNDVLPVKEIYKYSTFTPAQVQFRDGYRKAVRANLNSLSGEIEFIAPKGDTLVLEGVEGLANVAIGADTFFLYHGALQQIGSWKGKGRLLQHQSLQQEGVTRIGGYDSNDQWGGESLTSYSVNNQMRSLTVRSRTTFVRTKKVYFWKDDTEAPFVVDRRSLERAFPDRKVQIAGYIRTKKPDFRGAAEVEALLNTVL